MVDVKTLNTTISDFRDTVGALSEIRVISDNITKIKDDAVTANARTNDNANKIIAATDEIKNLSRSMVTSNDTLTESIREYNVSVHQSVDEIRQQGINNSREIREKVDTGLTDVNRSINRSVDEIQQQVIESSKEVKEKADAGVADVKEQLNNMHNDIINLIGSLEKNIVQCEKQIEITNDQLNKQRILIIACLAVSAVSAVLSVVSLIR